MPISSEALKQDLEQLTQDQLRQMADFIAFLKFRDKNRRRLTLNSSQVAAFATEEAEEDRAFAFIGDE